MATEQTSGRPGGAVAEVKEKGEEPRLQYPGAAVHEGS